MKRFVQVVFDEFMYDHQDMWTADIHEDLLGSVDQLVIQAIVDFVSGTSVDLTVAVESTSDGRNWVQQPTAAIDAFAVRDRVTNVAVGVDDGSNPTSRRVRFHIRLGGTTAQAHVRLIVCGRDANSAKARAARWKAEHRARAHETSAVRKRKRACAGPGVVFHSPKPRFPFKPPAEAKGPCACASCCPGGKTRAAPRTATRPHMLLSTAGLPPTEEAEALHPSVAPGRESVSRVQARDARLRAPMRASEGAPTDNALALWPDAESVSLADVASEAGFRSAGVRPRPVSGRPDNHARAWASSNALPARSSTPSGVVPIGAVPIVAGAIHTSAPSAGRSCCQTTCGERGGELTAGAVRLWDTTKRPARPNARTLKPIVIAADDCEPRSAMPSRVAPVVVWPVNKAHRVPADFEFLGVDEGVPFIEDWFDPVWHRAVAAGSPAGRLAPHSAPTRQRQTIHTPIEPRRAADPAIRAFLPHIDLLPAAHAPDSPCAPCCCCCPCDGGVFTREGDGDGNGVPSPEGSQRGGSGADALGVVPLLGLVALGAAFGFLFGVGSDQDDKIRDQIAKMSCTEIAIEDLDLTNVFSVLFDGPTLDEDEQTLILRCAGSEGDEVGGG